MRDGLAGSPTFRRAILLCVADRDGIVDVSCVEDDADDIDRSAAADDDESDADHDGGHLHDLADFERVGSVYFDEQFGGHWSAVLVEQAASGDGGGAGAGEKEEITTQRLKNAKTVVAVGLVFILIDRSRGISPCLLKL